MTVVPRPQIARVWDSCVIAEYLAGKPAAEHHARPIVESAKRGEIQIWVSLFAHVEVAFLDGSSETESETKIVAFFSEDYMVPIMLDPFVAEIARKIVRHFHVKGKDAVHVASAIRWNVRVFETFDVELIKKLGAMEADADWNHLQVREPFFDGQRRMV